MIIISVAETYPHLHWLTLPPLPCWMHQNELKLLGLFRSRYWVAVRFAGVQHSSRDYIPKTFPPWAPPHLGDAFPGEFSKLSIINRPGRMKYIYAAPPGVHVSHYCYSFSPHIILITMMIWLHNISLSSCSKLQPLTGSVGTLLLQRPTIPKNVHHGQILLLCSQFFHYTTLLG